MLQEDHKNIALLSVSDSRYREVIANILRQSFAREKALILEKRRLKLELRRVRKTLEEIQRILEQQELARLHESLRKPASTINGRHQRRHSFSL